MTIQKMIPLKFVGVQFQYSDKSNFSQAGLRFQLDPNSNKQNSEVMESDYMMYTTVCSTSSICILLYTVLHEVYYSYTTHLKITSHF